uniref:Insulin-degrading enzyme n=1 Tax=Mycena chlorophos TaxID=658473 RepID=A0ABQ0KWQ0_MYCCL|nr:insulin-degrading enzyme [Mycena chlorophos]GAT43339.1 insulin-degrading enzyme [Mycena chlorophos]
MGSTTDWTRVTPDAVPPFSVFTKEIVKSAQDDRDYRLIRLENGLQAMLVHDSKADKAAASLDVAVGHLHDPDDMPGLAHFCEHLLFMGTEQFPKENEYSEYLAKNNGASNAFTATSNTNYYFNVATTALPGALERFSGFFHSPLFAPSCTSRELNAVDSEHKKNHQQDMWRIFQVSKHLSVDGHVWRKFGSGNRDSLSAAAKKLKASGRLESTANGHLTASPNPSRLASPAPSVASTETDADDGGAIGRETRRRLIEWWSKEYCAGRMRLCIVGIEPLDELAAMASKLFSPIPNRGAEPLPLFTTSPIGPEQEGTLVGIQTIMTFRSMEISFPAEWQPPLWRHKPMQLIAHFVGHEGPGSIHSYLKNKGYITALSASPQSLARGLGTFKISLTLTMEGLKNHREVSLTVFKYLSLLLASVFEPFHQKEIVTLSETKFRFREKGRPDSYATSVTEYMARPAPPELTLASPSLHWDWGTDGFGMSKVREYLDAFRPEVSRIILMGKADELNAVLPSAKWEKEPWYETEYHVEKLDAAYIEEAQKPNDLVELALPGPNMFIPTNVEVDKRDVTEPAKRPYHIRETPLSTLWHKKDDQFWVPKAFAIMDLRTPFQNASPRAAVLTKLYSDIITDSLTEYAYDASLAMLDYRFIGHSGGLYIAINGYNDKLAVLVKHVLEKIKSSAVDPARLKVMKEQVKRDLENFWLGQSYTLSDHFLRYSLSETQWTTDEMLKELPSTTAEELQKHIELLLTETHTRILVSGNLYKDDAVRIAEMTEEGLRPSKLSPTELNERGLILPPGSNYTWTAVIPNPNQANSALTYYLHIGSVVDQHLRVTAALLSQLLKEPAFNILRTQEQLGYIVGLNGWTLSGGVEKGIRVVVQSEKTPGYLEDRVEAFLETMKTNIEEMSVETFAEHKESVKKRWTETDKNLTEEVTRLATHVMSGHFDFLRNDKDAEYLANVTKDDVMALFMSAVHPSSKTRAKLSIHMKSQMKRQPSISPAAANAFTALVRVKAFEGVSLDDAPSGDQPHRAADLGKFWIATLGAQPEAPELMKALQGLAAQYPVPGEGEDLPRPGVTYLTDLDAFRKGLAVSVDPGPMVDWPDLPVSKF